MLQTQFITVRKLLRNYQQVITHIQQTKNPAIITSHRKKQVAIIPIEDLQDLEQIKTQKSGKALLQLSKLFDTSLEKDPLPPDFATQHNYYAWDGEEKNES